MKEYSSIIHTKKLFILFLSVTLGFPDLRGQDVSAPVTIDSLLTLTRNLISARKPDDASLILEQVQQRITDENLMNSETQYSYLINKARIFTAKNAFDNAIEVYLQSLELATNIKGKESNLYADAAYGINTIYYRKGNVDGALKYANECIEIRKKLLPPGDPETAVVINSLAVLYRAKGEFAEAEKYNIEARELMEQYNHQDHSYYGFIMNNLANLYVVTNRYEEAEAVFKTVIAVRAKYLGEDHIDYARSINNLAIMYQNQGKYKEAEPLYLRSTEIAKNIYGTDHLEYANYMGSAAILYCITNEYEKAEPMLLQAQEIIKKSLGTENLTFTSSANNLANLYLQRGEYAKAEPLYRQVSEIRLKLFGPKNPDYAISLANYALLLYKMDRFEEAVQPIEESISICEATFGRKNMTTAYVYGVAGSIDYSRGEMIKAKEKLEISADVRKELVGEMHIDYAEALDKLGSLARSNKDFVGAEEIFRKTTQIRKEVLGENHTDYANGLELLASTLQAAGKIEEAKKYWLEFNDAVLRLIRRTSTFSTEEEMRSYLATFENRMAGFRSFSIDHADAELIAVNYNNALVMNGYLLENKKNLLEAVVMAGPEVQKDYEAWQEAQRKLTAEYSNAIGDQKDVKDLEELVGSLEKKLITSMSDFRQRTFPEWTDVVEVLKPGEVAVEMIRVPYFNPEKTDSVYYAALILEAGSKSPVMLKLEEEKAISNLMAAKGARKSQYVNRMYTIQEGKERLYDLVWKSIDDHFSKSQKNTRSKIYFVPTGLFHQLNISALPISENKRIGDQYSIMQLGSTRQLLEEKQIKTPVQQSALLVGGIVYDTEDQEINANSPSSADVATRSEFIEKLGQDVIARSGVASNWKYLPGTNTEINNIAKLISKGQSKPNILQGIAASEEALKSIGAEPPYLLHIATHGFFFPQKTEGTNVFSSSSDAMLRSGLILAGANKAWTTGELHAGTTEDGIFTAREISQINLRGTELVVLSACETGLGEIQGDEGVYGLQRAFKLAGAKNLIMSLWQVPDGQTSELMQVFYKEWLTNGKDIRTAFTSAQSQMRAKYEHPYFWAGFVLVE
ncbi:MAG: CHAT domain-containing protein [Saprospiraceae bacterium]|nr:CHAT domain-containing protein [Saprospiraceae bacterium]